MLCNIKVTKGSHPVELTYDGDGLRIDGDFNAHKKAKLQRACGCIPLPPPKNLFDPTLLPIGNTHLLQVFFNSTTHAIHIHALLPTCPDQDQSPLELYQFRYTVAIGQEQACGEFCTEVMEGAYQGTAMKKRLKVLVNPCGGQGKAKQIFETKVQPLFEVAKCTVDVQYTEYQGHAIQIAQDLDLEAYDTIVTVSGDGVIHEVINGLLQRSSGGLLPIGVIPGGTGNALSICLLGEQAGFDPMAAALQIIKGRSLALDLCSVTFDDHRYFSFLSQNYGITSYADLGTENMRWMGDARTTLGLLKEMMAGKTYGMEAAVQIVETNKTKIQQQYETAHASATWASVVDERSSDTIPALDEPVPEDWTHFDGSASFFLTSKTPFLARGMLSHPCALPNDGLLDLLMVRGNHGVGKLMDVFDKVQTGTHLDSSIVEYYKIKAFRLTPKPAPGQKAYVAIDGEHAPLKPFQVQVHPRMIGVLSLSHTFIHTHSQ